MIQTYTGELVVTTCAACGMTFGLEWAFERIRRDDHQRFFCPSGHPLVFHGRSDAEKANDAKEDAEREAQRLRDRLLKADADKVILRRQVAAQKGSATKLRQRIANGVCPCCTRHFANLQRHMDGQHPDYVTET